MERRPRVHGAGEGGNVTVDETIEKLKELSAAGHGNAPVIWQALSHTYDIEVSLKRRSGNPVVLVNP